MSASDLPGAAWGEGRKAPSFYALGDPLVGNPALAPEDSNGIDVEWSMPLGGNGLRMSIGAYRYDYENLIDFDFATFQLVNRSVVETRGAELELRGRAGEYFEWSLYVSAHRNEVDGVDDGLLHRPKSTAGGTIDWQINDDWKLFAVAAFEDDRPSSSVPGGVEQLPSTLRFDVTVHRTLGQNRDLVLAVDNVADRDWEAVAGIPSPGRQARLSVSQRF